MQDHSKNMKILGSLIFIQVLAFSTICDADGFGAKTFESVFLNNDPSKDIKETSKFSGNLNRTKMIDIFPIVSSGN